jgi:hypothetical protein
VTGTRTVGPEDLEALRIHQQRIRERLHQVPVNELQALQLAVLALENDRRIPEAVVEAVRQKLGAVVYAAHYGAMREAA